jgi:hypothetical protein
MFSVKGIDLDPLGTVFSQAQPASETMLEFTRPFFGTAFPFSAAIVAKINQHFNRLYHYVKGGLSGTPQEARQAERKAF